MLLSFFENDVKYDIYASCNDKKDSVIFQITNKSNIYKTKPGALRKINANVRTEINSSWNDEKLWSVNCC